MMLVSFRIALRSLKAHRLRSALTMLGIVIGVAAVVVMHAAGVGAREKIMAQVRSMGANLISIHPGSARMDSVRLGGGAAPNLSEDDATAIALEIPGVVVAAPVLYTRAQFAIGALNWQGAICGATPDYVIAREWSVVAGRPLTSEDSTRAARVVLLGAPMREKLFGGADPLDASIRVRDVPFTVVGVLERKGPTVWGDDQDDVALVPLTTARRQLVGTSRASPRLVHNITVKFAEGAAADETVAAITGLLRQRHRLPPGRDDTYSVSNLAEAADVEASTTRVLSLLLSAVASVALLVGGIGIMNIMLVTVTERLREIGIRLAVGARHRDILFQFIVEAATLAAVGGLLGAAAGIVSAITLGLLAQWPVVIELSAVLLAVAVASGGESSLGTTRRERRRRSIRLTPCGWSKRVVEAVPLAAHRESDAVEPEECAIVATGGLNRRRNRVFLNRPKGGPGRADPADRAHRQEQQPDARAVLGWRLRPLDTRASTASGAAWRGDSLGRLEESRPTSAMARRPHQTCGESASSNKLATPKTVAL
jgi:putative ABC transport system permease protein